MYSISTALKLSLLMIGVYTMFSMEMLSPLSWLYLLQIQLIVGIIQLFVESMRVRFYADSKLSVVMNMGLMLCGVSARHEIGNTNNFYLLTQGVLCVDILYSSLYRQLKHRI